MADPLVFICLLTYNRTQYAVRAIKAIQENLVYNNVAWYIADSGSSPEHVAILADTIGNKPFGHSEHLSPGDNWSKGIQWCLKQSEYYLRLEDDFVLTRRLELRKYVRLLQHRSEVGLVRFGLMPTGLEMESVAYDGDIYMNIYKVRQYCYSGHPHLTHARFHQAYGLYHSTANPGDCELKMDDAVRLNSGPQVWWPLDAGTWGWFGHIGAERSY